jgi:hypothetical protein
LSRSGCSQFVVFVEKMSVDDGEDDYDDGGDGDDCEFVCLQEL